MKKLILYDLDGTLADTRRDIIEAVQHMLAVTELPIMEASRIQQYVGLGVHHLIAGAMQTDDTRQIEKGIKIYRDHYTAHMLDHTRLYPGAVDVLHHFSARKQAVVTNKPNPYATDILKALGVAEHFTAIIGGDPGVPKKPDPAAVKQLMKAAGAMESETLFIGDSVIDIETAQNAGIEVIVLTHGFGAENELKSASPAGVFQDFYQMLDYIKEKSW